MKGNTPAVIISAISERVWWWGVLTSSVPAGWGKRPLRFLVPGGATRVKVYFFAATCGANSAFAQTQASPLKRSGCEEHLVQV